MSGKEPATWLIPVREANAQQNTIGALVYDDGQVRQLIEGEGDNLAMLYARLLQDSHPEQVCKFADMACCATKLRRLWKMVFYLVSAEQF